MATLSVSSLAPSGGGGIATLAYYRRLKAAQTTGVKAIAADLKNVDSLPIWLRVKKSLDVAKGWPVLSFQRSSDGLSFTEVVSNDVFQTGATGQSTAITLSDTVLIGLSVTGGGGGATLGSFRDVTGNIAGVSLPVFEGSQAAPNAPTGLAATGGNGKVDLAWSDPVGGAAFSGFEVVKGGAAIASVPSSTHSYSDSNVTNGTQYCYVVRATRGALKSPDSSQSCATPAGGGGETFRRGDADGNGAIEITDVIAMLGYQFLGSPLTLACFDAGDADDSGAIDINDPVYLINWLFLAGADIPAPGTQTCGPDPTNDLLPGPCVYTCTP